MYQIKCTTDGRDYVLFDLRDEEFTVGNPKLKLETNKVGELRFTIYDTHPYFDKIKKLKSIIRVYQFKKSPAIDGRVIFKGRVIEDEQGFNNEKKIECESKLAMLFDSQTPPFALENGVFKVGDATVDIGGLGVKNLFKWVIDTHNAQVEPFQRFELDQTIVTTQVIGDYKTLEITLGDPDRSAEGTTFMSIISASRPLVDGETLYFDGEAGKVFVVGDPVPYEIRVPTGGKWIKQKNKTITIGEGGAPPTFTTPKYCTVFDADNNGVITRTSPNYIPTYTAIESKFIDLLGGYINVIYDVEKDGELVDYIEYVHDFTETATQTIEFGENLLDISQVVSGADVATVLIPLGKTDVGDNTIKSIADGTYTDNGERIGDINADGDIKKHGDRIYSEKWVAEYGKIVKVETWDNVTDIENLFRKAIARLKGESVYLSASITLNAVDLALADKDVESFYWQDKIKVFSRPHGITHENDGNEGATYLLEKIEIDLLEPQNTEIVLGKTWRTITDVTLGAGKATGNIQTEINKVVADYVTNEQVKEISTEIASDIAKAEAETAVNNAINGEIETVIETTLENTSIIAQTAEEIIFEVVQNYVEKAGYEERQENISTTLQLLAEEMVLRFNTAIEEISTVDGEVQMQFQEISKYIRFVDGKIILGEVGNEITLEISNNRLSFLQNNLEVAYMSNNKLFVINSEFLGSLKIGNFAFTPRSNGNLSLKLSTATTPTIEDNDDATQ